MLEKGDQRTTGNVMENQEDYFEWLEFGYQSARGLIYLDYVDLQFNNFCPHALGKIHQTSPFTPTNSKKNPKHELLVKLPGLPGVLVGEILVNNYCISRQNNVRTKPGVFLW